MIQKYLSRFNLSRAALFIAVAAVVVYFLPRTDRTQLSYEPGRPWIHPLLTAPFDIPVYRDSISTRALIDSINDNFTPVYKIVSSPRDTLVERINRSSSLSTTQRSRLSAVIDTLYAHGVADLETAKGLHSKGNMAVVQDNIITIHDASGVRSQREAYAWATASCVIRQAVMLCSRCSCRGCSRPTFGLIQSKIHAFITSGYSPPLPRYR